MQILSLYLKNFRNYGEQFFEFGPQVNLICGSNGCGKTTILEAIHLLITGRSFRSRHLKELVKHQHSDFLIDLTFFKHGVEQSLRMVYSQKERQVFYNQNLFHSMTELIGLLPGILMVPDDISLVKGAPALRRKFLDLLLAQSDPLYVHHLTRYHHALRSRNVLLKRKQFEAIEVWEEELAKGAQYITFRRAEAVRTLQGTCSEILSQLSGKNEKIRLEYACQCPEECVDRKQFYSDYYCKMRAREGHIGCTLVGPHKDDLLMFVQDQDVRLFCSEGQQRCCVTALRFAEWEYVRQCVGIAPLMMIDDLGISLDSSRRTKLFEQLHFLQQIFITHTDKIVPENGSSHSWNLINPERDFDISQ